jgi:hypothetical protein
VTSDLTDERLQEIEDWLAGAEMPDVIHADISQLAPTIRRLRGDIARLRREREKPYFSIRITGENGHPVEYLSFEGYSDPIMNAVVRVILSTALKTIMDIEGKIVGPATQKEPGPTGGASVPGNGGTHDA